MMLCLLIAFLFIPGCARRQEAAPAGDNSGSSPAAVRGAPRPQREGRQPEAAAKPLDLQAYSDREDPLFGFPHAANLPRDFTLGLLCDESSTDSREIYSLAGAFFGALNAGKDANGYLHPDYRFFLERGIENAARLEAPASPGSPGGIKGCLAKFRLGEPRFSADRRVAQAKVLIMGTGGAKGRALGEIVAEKKDDRWYISGLAVDFRELFLPAEKSVEGFDPGPSAGELF